MKALEAARRVIREWKKADAATEKRTGEIQVGAHTRMVAHVRLISETADTDQECVTILRERFAATGVWVGAPNTPEAWQLLPERQQGGDQRPMFSAADLALFAAQNG